MLKAFSVYLAFLFVLLIPNLVIAEGQPELKKFCMWKASAAQVIAMNRDIGLDENEIISQYLKQGNSYNEQTVVLNLVDKIYGTYAFVTHDTIYLQTNKTCLREFYIDKTRDVFVSHNMK